MTLTEFEEETFEIHFKEKIQEDDFKNAKMWIAFAKRSKMRPEFIDSMYELYDDHLDHLKSEREFREIMAS
ncbi:MAG: hypothetical protein ACTSYA_10385 [Candidatus Kariarchaeaceae archaeon]